MVASKRWPRVPAKADWSSKWLTKLKLQAHRLLTLLRPMHPVVAVVLAGRVVDPVVVGDAVAPVADATTAAATTAAATIEIVPGAMAVVAMTAVKN